MRLPTPKVTEALPRWRVFAREIECDLSLYHHRDISDWHTGKLSSRTLLNFLDGLPGESWYKISAAAFVEEVKEEQERLYKQDVRNLIRAQLMGQMVEVV